MAHARDERGNDFIYTKHQRDIDLNCQICTKTLNIPRVLDCLHSFCEKCIKNNLEMEEYEASSEISIKCIICENFTDIPDGCVSRLPLNCFAKNAIDLLIIETSKESSVKCTNCEDGATAMSRCVECTEFLCSVCVTAHKRFRLTKDHRIILLDALQVDKSSVHRPVHCPQHSPELYMFYCEVCEELICKECTILAHRGHRYESLRDALEQKKPKLINQLEICERKQIPPIEKAIDEVQDMSARLHARTVAVKQALRVCTEECVQRLEERCEEMLEEIDSLYLGKHDVLQVQKERLQRELDKNVTARDFVDHSFKHGSEAEIFQLYDVMTNRLTELNGVTLAYKEPEDNDVIEHIYRTQDVCIIDQNLGKVSTSRIFIAHCFAEGPGLKTGKVGIESHFKLYVYDRFGDACVEKDHDDAIRVKIQAPEGFYINNKLTNNGDGSYTAKYTPVTKGKHELRIKIRGRPIPNNTRVVKVYEGIDYAKVSIEIIKHHSNMEKTLEEAYNDLILINVPLLLYNKTPFRKMIETVFLKFGTCGSKEGQMKQPWTTAVNSSGYIYVTDYGNNRVVAFDHLGNYATTFGSRGSKDGQMQHPTGIAVDSTGIVVVSDWDNHRLQLFSPNGKFIGKFGSLGSEEGQLNHPAGIAIDKNGHVVVAERDNHRIQVFTLDGKSVLTFGSRGNGPGQLESPTHVAVTENNSYIVSDAGNNRIVLFDSGGIYITHIGTKGAANMEFNRTSGVAVDKEGYIIVGDFYNHRIQVFSPDLAFLIAIGKEGKEDGCFKFPTGVTLNGEGRVVVTDRCNHRIQVF